MIFPSFLNWEKKISNFSQFLQPHRNLVIKMANNTLMLCLINYYLCLPVLVNSNMNQMQTAR